VIVYEGKENKSFRVRSTGVNATVLTTSENLLKRGERIRTTNSFHAVIVTGQFEVVTTLIYLEQMKC